MHTPRPLCTVALSQAQHHHHHHHSHSHNDHHCAAGRQAGRINEPNDNTINYKNSPQFICVCRGFIYVYEQLPPSATSPPCTHCTPSTLYHCRTVPLSPAPDALKPNYVRLLPLFTHLPRRRRTRQAAPKIKISSPSISKGGCVGVEPQPEPEQSPNRVESKPKLSPARIWHCLSCPCCLSMSPSVSQSVCPTVCFGCVVFLFSFFWASLLAASFSVGVVQIICF